MGNNAWRTAFRISGWVVGALLIVLAATGIALTYRYRPEQSFGYVDVQSLETSGPGLGLRWFHRASAFLILPAMLAFVIAAIGLLVQRSRRIAIALPVIAAFGVVGASLTGYLLPWDQLALNSVTVGENIRGYIDILGNNDVQYVLIGNSEVTRASLAQVYWLHAAVLPVIIVGLTLATYFATRGSAGRSEQAVVGEVGAGPQGAELLPHE